MTKVRSLFLFMFMVLLSFSAAAKAQGLGPSFYEAIDEAQASHLAGNFSDAAVQRLIDGSAEDYFHDMDYGVTNFENQNKLQASLNQFFPGITAAEAVRRTARGRNNWIVWTGGNDRFWYKLTKDSFGGLDFLKTVSDEPSLPANRDNRWEELGLVNEPCFDKAKAPREDRFGLWLPTRSKNCTAADPFENETNYPGVKIGSRGTTLNYHGKPTLFNVGSSYGYASGVIGLRLFPNPDFDQKAADRWDPVRYYSDAEYFNDPKTVRPYRVGMACALCHVGPNPSHPPENFDHPKWENLSSNPGAQYFWFDRVFFWDYKKHSDNFLFQILHTSRPGALDTSLVSSDQINNPRTMNAVYDIPARMELMQKFGSHERLSGPELLNKQFNLMPVSKLPANSMLRDLYSPDGQVVTTPRVLKDGSDSVGVLGALNRVYVNIGLFSEEWVKHFIPLLGGPNITPFPIQNAEKNSLYWKALTDQTPDVALFFLATSKSDALATAPSGKSYLKASSTTLNTGRKVFAENCAACHSSKLPSAVYGMFNKADNSCDGANYLTCWKNYWDYTKTNAFKTEMLNIAMKSDFLKGNYLSTELRIPVTLLDSQLCSPVATNAIAGSIWDNFSSTTYKTLPSVGSFRVNYPDPTTTSLQSEMVQVPAGGRGFLRPPSLISLWATAPLLQNNSLGHFDEHGTVAGRMSSFDDSIHQLLYPETRSLKSEPGKLSMTYTTQFGDHLQGFVDVTTEDSYLKIPKTYLPRPLRDAFELAAKKDKADARYANHPLITKGPALSLREKPKKNWFQRLTRSLASSSDDATDETDEEIYYNIGPIPGGVPINLISNINLSGDLGLQLGAINALVKTVIEIRLLGLAGDDARKFFVERATTPLLRISTCKDFVVNRGHYFGTQFSEDAKAGLSTPLTDPEKAGLIEFLKQM